MEKSSKDIICFLLSPFMVTDTCFIAGTFLQILQFLPLSSLYCNDLLMPVFYLYRTGLQRPEKHDVASTESAPRVNSDL